VNGHSLVNADHHHAVAVLKSAGNDITMVINKASNAPTHQASVVNGSGSGSCSSGSMHVGALTLLVGHPEEHLAFKN